MNLLPCKDPEDFIPGETYQLTGCAHWMVFSLVENFLLNEGQTFLLLSNPVEKTEKYQEESWIVYTMTILGERPGHIQVVVGCLNAFHRVDYENL